jgi:phospholipid transport system substrate-binding protein
VKKSLLAVLLLSAFAVLPQLAGAQEPLEQVEQAIAELTAGLEGRQEELADDPAALYEFIDGILLPRFDQKYAAQLVLGKNWRDADADQRERFIDGFYSSLLRKYAEGVLEFDQKQVQVLPFRGDLNDKRTIVKTIVSLDDGTKVTVNYGFANRNEGWKMFDVTIEGISYIRNYRAELASEISSSSLDEVIDRFEAAAGGSPVSPLDIAADE